MSALRVFFYHLGPQKTTSFRLLMFVHLRHTQNSGLSTRVLDTNAAWLAGIIVSGTPATEHNARVLDLQIIGSTGQLLAYKSEEQKNERHKILRFLGGSKQKAKSTRTKKFDEPQKSLADHLGKYRDSAPQDMRLEFPI